MLNRFCYTRCLLIFLSLLFSFFQVQQASEIVFNTLKKIDEVEGKIKLKLDYVWGNDETEDIEQVFRYPADINIDSKGRIYIVDFGRNRIQVFDKSRKFIRTIGEMGKGPGNFLNPIRIMFTSNNNIAVLDSYNFRIQMFNPEGISIDSFRYNNRFLQNFSITTKDDLLLYLPEKEDKRIWTISSFNLKGKPLRRIYSIPCRDREYSLGTSTGSKTIRECDKEYITFLSDSRGDVFISYKMAPVYQRLSSTGDLKLTVVYEVPFKSFKIGLESASNIPSISTEKEKKRPTVSVSMAVDGQGRTFLIVNTRRAKKEDYYILAGSPGNIRRIQKEFPEKSDSYRLLVFNNKGNIIAAKKLFVYCERMVVHKNRIFIIDKYIHSVIHEYTFEI